MKISDHDIERLMDWAIPIMRKAIEIEYGSDSTHLVTHAKDFQ